MTEYISLGLGNNLHKKMVFIDNVIFQDWYTLGWYYAVMH